MRNLHLIRQQFHKFNFNNELFDVVGITEDGTSLDDSFFGVTRQGMLFRFNTRTGKLLEQVDLMHVDAYDGDEGNDDNDESMLLSPGAQVVGIQFVAELESVCVVSDLGDIVTYHVESRECDVVGLIEEGIECMSWSPDQEIVVFATSMQTIIMMTKDWAVLCNNPIDSPPTKPQPKPVQLQHQQTAKEDTDGDVSETKAPHISWRGDGQMFAVNSCDEIDGKQWIRVWERSGAVISKTEPINGLGRNVHWVPDGHIIASHQYLSSKKQTNIVFFEKNGLQHYDFMLSQGRAVVHSLQWNQESEILAVLFTPPGDNQVPILQLWYRGNYHWYLKQEMVYEEKAAPQHFTWDPTTMLRLHVFCKDGTYWCNDFTWESDISPGMDHRNPCVASVIDGSELKLTPFRFVSTPPPMCNSAINTRNKSNINRVSMSTVNGSPGSCRILLQTSRGEVEIYEVEPASKPPRFGLAPKFIGTLALDSKRLRLMTLISPDILLAVESSEFGSGEDVLLMNIGATATAKNDKIDSHQLQRSHFDEKIIGVCVSDKTHKIFLETADGVIFEQQIDSIGKSYPMESEEQSFQYPCQHIAVCMMGGEEVVVGLSDKGVLYLQSNVACTNCSSFVLHDKFLLFTTYGNKLRAIPLHLNVFDALELANANPSFKYDDSFREIERGARIVTAVPMDIRVILQMPRGNLELIYPRALVLSYIRDLLNNFDYGQAVQNARKHKIDLNLIYDHDPQALLSHTDEFVEKVDNAEYINLFLSLLSNEDTTKTKFPGYFADIDEVERDEVEPASAVAKVNTICSSMRTALTKANSDGRFTSSILTTYAKQQPPQLEEALENIRELRARTSPTSERPAYETALQHLILLADVNKLFDVALGMYDFELVTMVAKKSQKDPKEYLPFLTKLQKMEPAYMKYTIDTHLGRYESALKNLASSESEQHFAECMQLIREHHLYKLALELFVTDDARYAQVFEAYGDHLSDDRSELEQAAYAYMQCKKYAKAQEAFKNAGDYRMAFALTKQLNQTKEEVRNLARDLVNVLSLNRKALEAAIVYRDYLQDLEEAILHLIKSQLWQDAIHFASLGGRHDLIETHIRPAVQDTFDERLEELRENSVKFEKYINRLAELREEKRKQQELLQQQQQELMEGEFGEDEQLRMQNLDTLSDTSSVQSGVSGYSGVSVYTTTSTMSSASTTSSAWVERRRAHKNKRKRVKMKKGSLFEEDNIVSRLQSLLPSETVQSDIGHLIQALVFFGKFDEARRLQLVLESAIHIAEKHESLFEQTYIVPPTAGQPLPFEKTPKKMVEILGKEEERWRWKLIILQ